MSSVDVCCQVSQWVSYPVNSSRVWGYTQWKPVAYRKSDPVTDDATPCRHSEPVHITLPPRSALIQAYFSNLSQTRGLNVSFGIAGDAFYNATNYLSWWVCSNFNSVINPQVNRFFYLCGIHLFLYTVKVRMWIKSKFNNVDVSDSS